jgi:Asp-tRNA(Asn)/Glu-tRNA(Gln) amidotransferase A subunit family amidase
MNLPWTQSGLPAIGIPAGSNSAGLPLGIQLVGRWNEDERLLSQAEQIEKTLSAWAGNGRMSGNGHMRGNGRPGKGH